MPGSSDKTVSLTDPDLKSLWDEGVASGRFISEFDAPRDDPKGRWKGGDQILFGIVGSDTGLRYYAKNLSADKLIDAEIEEKQIPGTGFRCQFNEFRALRPGGDAPTIGRRREISPSPLECRFYCQEPARGLSLHRRTPLAQLRLKNHLWNAYYNAAPLEIEGHFIWLPVLTSGARLTLPHYPQNLDRALVEDLFLLHDGRENFVLFFNSLHAGASVNHLHVHMVYRKHPLAIEKAQARHPYVLDEYLAGGFLFQGSRSRGLVSEYVLRLQALRIPFNLVWIGERVFLLPRNVEHEVIREFPSDTFGALDICGRISTANRATYDAVNKELITAALTKLVLQKFSIYTGY